MNFLSNLNQRRLDLGMSCAAIAQHSGLSLRTVQRVFSGEESDPNFKTISVIAEVVGVSITMVGEDVNTVRRRQAERKADKLLSIVQGTSGLEAQAVDRNASRTLHERTVRDLLASSSRKLWAD